MSQYKFDALRYCRNNAGRLKLPDGSDPMERIAEELQRARELHDAVAWEREFDEVLVWLVQTGLYPRDMRGKYDLAAERECARAEVDRLIANGGGQEDVKI